MLTLRHVFYAVKNRFSIHGVLCIAIGRDFLGDDENQSPR
jgi:hypothetical protein